MSNNRLYVCERSCIGQKLEEDSADGAIWLKFQCTGCAREPLCDGCDVKFTFEINQRPSLSFSLSLLAPVITDSDIVRAELRLVVMAAREQGVSFLWRD